MEIRQLYKPWEFGYVKLSKIFGLHPSAIRNIVKCKRWKHLPEHSQPPPI